MVTDEKVDAALEYLRTNAPKAAQAKANRIYLEEYRKVIKSNQMKQHLTMPLAAQEREAYSSDEYIQHLEALKEAVQQDELHRWGMVAATATIEAWRTHNANKRNERV